MSIHYEPISNINGDYFNNCTPTELLQGVHDSYRVNYKGMSFAEKKFHMARQFFVRRVLEYCLLVTDAFEMLYQVTKKVESMERECGCLF